MKAVRMVAVAAGTNQEPCNETLRFAPWPKGAVRWPHGSHGCCSAIHMPFFAHARRHILFFEAGIRGPSPQIRTAGFNHNVRAALQAAASTVRNVHHHRDMEK